MSALGKWHIKHQPLHTDTLVTLLRRLTTTLWTTDLLVRIFLFFFNLRIYERRKKEQHLNYITRFHAFDSSSTVRIFYTFSGLYKCMYVLKIKHMKVLNTFYQYLYQLLQSFTIAACYTTAFFKYYSLTQNRYLILSNYSANYSVSAVHFNHNKQLRI